MMAFVSRVNVALAVLIVEISALQLTPETIQANGQPTIQQVGCGEKQRAYEVNHDYYCSIFCVPEGDCEKEVRDNKLGYLGSLTADNYACWDFTEPVPVTYNNETLSTAEWLKTIEGPCEGTTLNQIKTLAPVEEICDPGSVGYEAYYTQFPNVCGLFCVPKGECEEAVMQNPGRLSFLHIRQRGDCTSKAFRVTGTSGKVDFFMDEVLRAVKWPCEGMTYVKFKKEVVAGVIGFQN